MSHEASRMTEMEDYFRKKFAPTRPMFMIGRSSKLEPLCEPRVTLFDVWTELLMHSLHHRKRGRGGSVCEVGGLG